MADRDELGALAAGRLPAPARVVALDVTGDDDSLEPAVADLSTARGARCRITLRLGGMDAALRPILEAMSAARRARHRWRRLGAEATGMVNARLAALGACLGREGRRLAPDALALPADVAQPEEVALGAAAACDGNPPVYLLLPAVALEAVQRRRALPVAGGFAADARRWWCGLLALVATAPAVSLVPGVPGPGLSRLAPGPRWAGPSPQLAELIPEAPCRLRLDLDFAALLAACEDQPTGLARLAGRVVCAADALLDQALGPSGSRRLALHLEGVAAAVMAAGRDPRQYATLQWLTHRLRAFRDGARAASVKLARTRGAGGGLQPFPLPESLEVAEAGALERAVLVHGARHSHLVCLSPWSLAPAECGRDGLGLLPALSCADSIAWCRPAGEYPVDLYGEALRFAWAVALRS